MHIAIKDKTGKTVMVLSGAIINIRMIEPGFSITALEHETEAGNEILTGVQFDEPLEDIDDPRHYDDPGSHYRFDERYDYSQHDWHEMSRYR